MISVPTVVGGFQGALLEQRIDEETVQLVQCVLIEITFEEDQFGELDLGTFVERDPELVRGISDRCGSRVGVDRSDGQTVPGGHWREPSRRSHARHL